MRSKRKTQDYDHTDAYWRLMHALGEAPEELMPQAVAHVRWEPSRRPARDYELIPQSNAQKFRRGFLRRAWGLDVDDITEE